MGYTVVIRCLDRDSLGGALVVVTVHFHELAFG